MLEFTKHAAISLQEREIPIDWVENVIENPSLRIPDRGDPELERFYGRVPQFGNRVLRAVVNTQVAPWRVVSVFFDRSMKGKL